jgi:hypothetical protein
MAILRLSNPQPNTKKGDELKISLTLSYIEKSDKPDAFHLKVNDFKNGNHTSNSNLINNKQLWHIKSQKCQIMGKY